VYAGSTHDDGNVNGGTTAQYRHVCTYTVDVRSAVYIIRGACGSVLFPAACQVAVNGPVQIALGNVTPSIGDRIRNRDGEQIYMKDDSGNEYKFVIAKKTIKQTVKQP
jgi:hypothetical protein